MIVSKNTFVCVGIAECVRIMFLLFLLSSQLSTNLSVTNIHDLF